MKIFTWIKNTIQYLGNGVSRLFEPTDDNYPQTGVQPFHGDTNQEQEEYY